MESPGQDAGRAGDRGGSITNFRILGPVEVWRDGTPLLLGPKHRTLLAALLLRANRVVTADQLINYLWADRPPISALNLLRGYTSELRKTLQLGRSPDAPPPSLLTRAPGYLLTLTREQLDLYRFEDLLAIARTLLGRGDAARGAESLRDALALWRGTALDDVDSDPLRQHVVPRLAELRVTALEERIDADLLLGRHVELVAELTALTAAHPTRERFRGQLMLALYRSGRQADALAAYRTARLSLIAELGIEPGRDLQRLERAMLAADPTLDTPAPPAPTTPAAAAPWQVRADIADFTGREKTVATVQAVLESDSERGTAIVISAIAGKAGVGKTTLAVHVAHQLRSHFPDGQLYVNLNGAQADPLEPTIVLGRFLRALGVDGAAVPPALDDQIDAYHAQLTGKRVLVVLDNAADEAQIRALIPTSPGCAALITSRSRLAALESAHTVDLDVLDHEQALRLLTRIVGPSRIHRERKSAEEIAALCGYLPLALRIAGSKLAAKPHWPVARLAARLRDQHERLNELRIGDLEVRASLALSYEAAPPTERRAFRLLGLLPEHDFGSWVLAPLLGCSPGTADMIVESLVDQRLLEPANPDERGSLRYRFHDLLRDLARERLREEEPADARHAAHEQFLQVYLMLAFTAGAQINPAGLRHHDRRSPSVATDPALVDLVRNDPVAWFAAEQTGLYAAVEQAHSTGRWDLTWSLSHTAEDFLEARTHWQERLHAIRLGLDAARRCDDRRATAISLMQLGTTYRSLGRIEEPLRWFTASATLFAEIGDRRREAHCLRAAADLHRGQGRMETAAAMLATCRSLFHELDDATGEAYALGTSALIHRNAGRITRAVDDFQQGRALLVEQGVTVLLPEVDRHIGALQLELGNWTEALEKLTGCLPQLRSTGNRPDEAFAHWSLGMAYTAILRSAAAQHHLEETLAIAAELGGHRIAGYALHSLAVLRRTQRYGGTRVKDLINGEPATRSFVHGPELVRCSGDLPSSAFALHGLGIEYGELGEHDAATETLERALTEHVRASDRPGQANAHFSMGIVAGYADRPEHALTYLGTALAMFEEHGNRFACAEAHGRLGDVHARAANHDTAAIHWTEALELYRDLGVPDDPRIPALEEKVRGGG